MSTPLALRHRVRAAAQRIYVNARDSPKADRAWIALSLGVAMALLGTVVLNPALVLGGLALGSIPLMMYGFTYWVGEHAEAAQQLRFRHVVPADAGRPAWRQVLAYARRRSTEDQHAKAATLVGAIFVFFGIVAPGAGAGTLDTPAWFELGFGAAALVAPWLLELLGAAIMYEPDDERWDRVWSERVLDPYAGRNWWSVPSFWILVVVFVLAVLGAVVSFRASN